MNEDIQITFFFITFFIFITKGIMEAVSTQYMYCRAK